MGHADGLLIERFLRPEPEHILTRFFEQGAMQRDGDTVAQPLDGGLGIEHPERLLFELLDRDGGAVADIAAHFANRQV